MKTTIAAIVAATFSMSAHAQHASGHAIDHYKTDGSPAVGDWRQANDRVHEAGGWKAYAREIERDRKAQSAAAGTATELTAQQAVALALRADPNLSQTVAAIADLPSDASYIRLNHAQREALSRMARLRADVLRIYYAAIAAQEKLRYQHQVTETAAIAAELASRMRQAGNLNVLHQAEEQLSYADTAKALARAQAHAVSAREALIRRLRLSGEEAKFSLPQRLSDLPAQPRSLSAVQERLMREEGFPRSEPPSQIAVRSEARDTYANYRQAYQVARHYRDEIVPLQKKISAEHLLHYNGMIIGVFDLLKDAKHQIKAVEGYMEAMHSFWNADALLASRLALLEETFAESRRDAWK